MKAESRERAKKVETQKLSELWEGVRGWGVGLVTVGKLLLLLLSVQLSASVKWEMRVNNFAYIIN